MSCMQPHAGWIKTAACLFARVTESTAALFLYNTGYLVCLDKIRGAQNKSSVSDLLKWEKKVLTAYKVVFPAAISSSRHQKWASYHMTLEREGCVMSLLREVHYRVAVAQARPESIYVYGEWSVTCVSWAGQSLPPVFWMCEWFYADS